MKTDQLVEALVADRATHRPIAHMLVGGLAAGLALSLAAFFLELGVRTDLAAALATWRFDLKIVTMMLALALTFGLCVGCIRPEGPRHPLLRLLPLLVLAAAAIAVELATVPMSQWKGRLIGSNSMICLSAIPVLSLAPLAATLFVLRRGAPTSPAGAGAAAGLLAAACGAVLYAFHCFDDSPLFVATWYTLAALPMVAIGALAGRRLLRW